MDIATPTLTSSTGEIVPMRAVLWHACLRKAIWTGGVVTGIYRPPGIAEELPPWRVRPRLPDLFPYEQSTTVLTDVNTIRGNIGRTLRTGHDIERVYWNRDRLYPVYIRQHVDTLKQAVRKWIDETS
jgi:hypothetical protein